VRVLFALALTAATAFAWYQIGVTVGRRRVEREVHTALQEIIHDREATP
jgi:hypothetical protein